MSNIDAKRFVDGLLDLGFDFFSSVPCSYFGPLLTELERREGVEYQVATVEAEAIALATGAALGGRKPVVMLQNSGLGNCVNPISSLLNPFQIPMVLLVSHRGHTPDAPQHELMGRVTPELLDLLEVPHVTLPEEHDPALKAFENSLRDSLRSNLPHAILIQKKLFSRTCEERVYQETLPTRIDAMSAIQEGLTDECLAISSTGMMSRDMHNTGDRAGTFYMVGSMGLASSIGLGLARSQKKPVVVVDGDGSFLMRLGACATIGKYHAENLLHIILDNGTHSSTGGQPTAARNIDIPALARSCGYKDGLALNDLKELQHQMGEFLSGSQPGPRLLHFRIRSGNERDPKRVSRSLPKVKADFMKRCQPETKPEVIYADN